MKSHFKFLLLIATAFYVGPAPARTGDRASHLRDQNVTPQPKSHVDAIRPPLTRTHVHLLSDTQVSFHSLGHWETKEKDTVDIWYSNLILSLANDFFNERKTWFEKKRTEVIAMPPGIEKDERWRKLWNYRLIALAQGEKIHEAALTEYRRRQALIATWKDWYLNSPATAANKHAADRRLEAKRQAEAETQIETLGQAMKNLRKNF